MTMLVRQREPWSRFRTCVAYAEDFDPAPATATIRITNEHSTTYPNAHHVHMRNTGYTSNTFLTTLYDHLWILNTGAGNYQANARFFAKFGTGTMGGSAANTWLDCSTNPNWSITLSAPGSSQMSMWLQLREKDSTKLISNVYAEVYVIVTAGCPDPNMRITLSDNSLCRAGDLKVGMMVLSKHEKTGELGAYKVIKTQPRHAIKLRIRFDDGKEVICSDLHRFYLENSNVLIRACKLSAGMRLGDSVVKSVDFIGTGDVIDIEVEDSHTYYMEGLLSHNFK